MEQPPRDDEREDRIRNEILVDAYGPEEQALSWYYALDENLSVPFRARCVAKRATSPLRIGDDVEVVGMPPEEECEHEMFVLIRWRGERLAVPLSQLEGGAVDEQTRQAIEDWRYWVGRGNEL